LYTRKTPPDYLAAADLAALGLDAATIARLLRDTPLSGHDGKPVVEAERLADLLGMLDIEDQQ
jgi:hypothetical protein